MTGLCGRYTHFFKSISLSSKLIDTQIPLSIIYLWVGISGGLRRSVSCQLQVWCGLYMMEFGVTSQLIKPGLYDHPSNPSKGQSGVLQLMAIQIYSHQQLSQQDSLLRHHRTPPTANRCPLQGGWLLPTAEVQLEYSMATSIREDNYEAAQKTYTYLIPNCKVASSN